MTTDTSIPISKTTKILLDFLPSRRDKIIDLLGELHKKYHGSTMPLQFKNEISLEKFVYKRGDKRERNFVTT